MNDLECPYCDAPNEVCHDDGQGYDEGKAHEMTCADCGHAQTLHGDRAIGVCDGTGNHYPHTCHCKGWTE